tara:strand:+ start:6244 stop:7296 length:1053 start_codon:yes stop_codon:yes gene_type:complete
MKLQLLRWYDNNNYDFPWRNSNDPYKVWISEVMLQQTQVNTVIPYFNKWMKRFPTIQDVAQADIDIILKYWEGLGYYSRAHNIKKSASILCQTMNAKLPKNNLLRSLPGIGDYMEGSIMSIAFNKPYPAVDGNVKRVFSRFLCENFKSQKEIKKLKKYILKKIHKTRPGCFNQAVMDLGREICKPSSPLCNCCPIQNKCIAYNKNLTSMYPQKIIKKKRPSFDIVVGFIVNNKNNFLITKRPQNKMLGGLWELPGGKRGKGESLRNTLIREIKEEINIDINVNQKMGVIQHSYSHMNINLHGYLCNIKKGKIRKNECVDAKWINMKQIENFTFPKASHKLFSIIKEYYVN